MGKLMAFIKINFIKLIFLGFAGIFSGQILAQGSGQPLHPDQAFKVFVGVEGQQLVVAWDIAEGYYLYRNKFKITAQDSNIILAEPMFPAGEIIEDNIFGRVEIYRDQANASLPLPKTQKLSQLDLWVQYQGCADIGVCYPPQKIGLSVNLPNKQAKNNALPASIYEQDGLAIRLDQDSFWLTMVSFFGFGLLLAFTPCVFPMIPILSGIIVAQGAKITILRSFLLSLCYVLAATVAYTSFGVLAALFGANLQADLQQPWIVILFSSIFVLLALSMFGFYNFELPNYLQQKIRNASTKQYKYGLVGAALMGGFSALIVGPCVAAPLAGALIYIGQTGDVVLGAAALFVMGLGMGVPLLILGASAGSILPKTGRWLDATKAIFGVIMLAVAVWMLERILPAPVSLFLWALLLLLPAIFLNALDALPEGSSGWRKIWKGIGVVMLVYGTLLLIGLATGNNNPLRPLKGFDGANIQVQKIKFANVVSVQDLEQKVQQASTKGKWVMLDYYADWCISCKEMEAYTFSDPQVQQILATMTLLRADITKMNTNDKALLERFALIGPPAILFFDTHQQERVDMRVIGYLNAKQFISHLQKKNYASGRGY